MRKFNFLLFVLIFTISISLFSIDTLASGTDIYSSFCSEFDCENVKISIKKKDEETKASLDGAVFGLYTNQKFDSNDGSISISKGKRVFTVTSLDGIATFDGSLPKGSFYIKELDSPEGYYLSDRIITLHVSDSNNDFQYTYYNKKIPEDEFSSHNNSSSNNVTHSGKLDVELLGPQLSSIGSYIPYTISTIHNDTADSVTNFCIENHFSDTTYLQNINTGAYNADVPINIYFKEQGGTDWVLWQSRISSLSPTILDAYTLSMATGSVKYISDIMIDFGTVPSGFNCTTAPTYNLKVTDAAREGSVVKNEVTLSGIAKSGTLTDQASVLTNIGVSLVSNTLRITPKTGDINGVFLSIISVILLIIAFLFLAYDYINKYILFDKIHLHKKQNRGAVEDNLLTDDIFKSDDILQNEIDSSKPIITEL